MSDELGTAIVKLVEDAAPEVRAALEASGALDVLRQGVGIAGDRVWLRRQERFAVGLAQAARRLQEKGVPLAAISDKTLRAVYENLSVEDDEDLRVVWVKLLETALGGEAMPPVYPEVLSQMEPIEARFFDAVSQAQKQFLPQPWLSLDQIEETARAILPDLKWRHLDNLERLGLLTYSWNGPVNVERPKRPIDRPFDVVCSLTPLGEDFITYCSS